MGESSTVAARGAGEAVPHCGRGGALPARRCLLASKRSKRGCPCWAHLPCSEWITPVPMNSACYRRGRHPQCLPPMTGAYTPTGRNLTVCSLAACRTVHACPTVIRERGFRDEAGDPVRSGHLPTDPTVIRELRYRVHDAGGNTWGDSVPFVDLGAVSTVPLTFPGAVLSQDSPTPVLRRCNAVVCSGCRTVSGTVRSRVSTSRLPYCHSGTSPLPYCFRNEPSAHRGTFALRAPCCSMLAVFGFLVVCGVALAFPGLACPTVVRVRGCRTVSAGCPAVLRFTASDSKQCRSWRPKCQTAPVALRTEEGVRRVTLGSRSREAGR